MEGARHCLAAKIVPQVVIGDFDLLLPGELEKLQALGAQIIRYPTRKDFTDLELALEYAREQVPEQIIVLGGLGQRWDQTLANIFLLANPANMNFKISLIDGNQEIMLIRGFSRPLKFTDNLVIRFLSSQFKGMRKGSPPSGWSIPSPTKVYNLEQLEE